MSKATQAAEASIAIRAEPSLIDPNQCKFVVSRQVHPGGPFLFESAEQGKGSPLVEKLFAIPGVASVIAAENVVIVGKRDQASWRDLAKAIGTAIRTQLLTGVRGILEHPPAAASANRGDAEIQQLVQELLDKEINPSVASHGGKISVIEVKDRVLYLRMSGGCQGCAAAQITLRQGVETMVRRVVPELKAIVDSTDHQAGTRPFYSEAP